MTITNLPSPILPLILNHESLERVSDFKAIRAVCRCFNDHKTVQRLRVQHTGPNSIFSFVHDKQVECLALSGDLVEITVPGLLPAALKELRLGGAKNIPPALINVVLRSSTIENLNLSACDLSGISVPESLPASLKELNLYGAKNILPALIDKALRSSTIEKIVLFGCNLAEITVPASLPASLKKLDLREATNVPPELINISLGSSTIEKLCFSQCDLAGITVPDSLPALLKKLNLRRSRNIPPDLITKARACPHCVVITN